MVIPHCCCAVCWPSVTCSVNAYVPGEAMTVPAIVPLAMVRLGGSPPTAEKLYTPVPPVAVKGIGEIVPPLRIVGSGQAVVIVSAGPLTTKVTPTLREAETGPAELMLTLPL